MVQLCVTLPNCTVWDSTVTHPLMMTLLQIRSNSLILLLMEEMIQMILMKHMLQNVFSTTGAQ